MNLRALVSAGVCVTSGLAAMPSAATASTYSDSHFINALLPNRIAEQIGFVPVVGMQKLGAVKLRVGGDVYRGEWINSLATRLSTTQALTEIRRYELPYFTYADRKLGSAERRRFEVLLDIGRDADVLAVKAGSPLCTNGVTLAQARGIATGKITNWSAVGGGSGSIALRHVVVRGTFEPRLGAAKKPAAAKGRADGGVADAAQDASVAAVTSWSRARSRGDVCAVPVDGLQPTNTTVHGLTYKGAYPVTFVGSKKRKRDAISKARVKYYVNFLKSAAATKVFRGTGMLLTAEKPSDDTPGGTNTGGTAGPSRDAQGRPITAVQDQGGARAALEGERLQQPREPGYTRLAFEAGGVVRIVEGDGATSCSAEDGSWSLLDGWRYSENGGGYIVQVRFNFGTTRDGVIELPDDPGDTAWYDGQQWQRARSLPGSC